MIRRAFTSLNGGFRDNEPRIALDVEFYDEEQERLLTPLLKSSRVDELIGVGLELSLDELLIFGTFKYQHDRDGVRNRSELERLVSKIRNGMLTEFFSLEEGSVHARSLSHRDNDSTDTCGVAASLAVASELFGLHEADWEKIAVSQKKDLDFRIKASDASRFVVVEAKGRLVSDIDALRELSSAKGDILQKKKAQRHDDSRDLYLGIIAAFPMDLSQRAKCRLVDPPIADVPEDPRKYKLLCRLSHYQRELSVLSRSPIVGVLANRIRSIWMIDEYEQLDGGFLIDRSGEQLQIPNSTLTTRSTIEKQAFGEVVPLEGSEFYFYGMLVEVLSLLIRQDHDEILDFQVDVKQVQTTVIARVFPSDLEGTGIDTTSLRKVANSSRVAIEMSGLLSYTAGGHVLGSVRPISNN